MALSNFLLGNIRVPGAEANLSFLVLSSVQVEKKNMIPETVTVAAAVFLPNFGAMLGQKLTRNTYRRDVWYKALQKPFFCPPTWVFPPAWIALYSSMGYASYLVWRDGGGFRGKAAVPLAWYSLQLGMNWGWSHIFFGAKMIGLAEIELVALLGAASATTVCFKSINATAYRLMVPYVAWLAFASLSIFEIWRLNRNNKQLLKLTGRNTG